jgi:hypothetical protein
MVGKNYFSVIFYSLVANFLSVYCYSAKLTTSPGFIYFSPNGDGIKDTAEFSIKIETGAISNATIYAEHATIPSYRKVLTEGASYEAQQEILLTWDGRCEDGQVHEGMYNLKITYLLV